MNEKIYTEQQEKLRAYEAQQAQGTVGYGASTLCDDASPKRESLTERFKSQASRLNRDNRKLDQINELLYLLEKNPEVACILDLVDSLGSNY